MMHPFTPLTLLALLSLPAMGAAQNLIALTRNTQSIHQGVHATCTPLGTCPTTLLPQTAAIFHWPGGTAWDGTTNSLWVTTGKLLERRAVAPCSPLNNPSCAQMLCPKSSLAAEAMGMDINELTNELWILDDAGIVTRCTNACQPVILGSFPVPILALVGGPSNPTVGTAIAIDELHGLVFYTRSDFGGSGSFLHVAQLANPSAITQTFPITVCFGALVTGMAVHPGLGKLYITNGRETYDYNFTYISSTFSLNTIGSTCCTLAPPGDPYIDLSIRWRPPVPLGEPCANGSCPVCFLTHTLGNAPLLGNNLQLRLDFAPPGWPVWCLLGFGPCQPTGPQPAPLCGPVHVPIGGAPYSVLPMQVTAGGPCAASAVTFQQLPISTVWLGTTMSSQYVGLCPPTGTMMSNCLSWVIQ